MSSANCRSSCLGLNVFKHHILLQTEYTKLCSVHGYIEAEWRIYGSVNAVIVGWVKTHLPLEQMVIKKMTFSDALF